VFHRRPGGATVDGPSVSIVVHRPPNRVDTYRQELLSDEPDLKITLQELAAGIIPLSVGNGILLGPGSQLLWFTFPGAHSEVGAFYDAEGQRLGCYGNLILPTEFDGATWHVRDLFLDVWLPSGGSPQLLDEADFDEARARGWITAEEASRARAEASRITDLAAVGAWPPKPVRRWTLDLVPSLRLRRDHPGTYWAALVSGRLIGWGLYVFGLASATSVAFAAFTDAFVTSGRAQSVWVGTLVFEALLLLPFALGGLLPATRWPRPALTDERTLFIGTLATGLAVLGLNDLGRWSDLLAGVYGSLVVFLGIFAVCRAFFDRTFPTFAAAGLIVAVAALVILL
jgi:predicted RNA-binding protein associated with RNAse of E/G family